MGNVDTFGAYVRSRLEGWGREFALHRDCEYLGHRSKDMLQLLIEHGGEMPPRVTGFKPIEIPPEAMQVEDMVADIARVNLTRAIVLRAYYCGSGRRGSERFDTANAMLRAAGLPTINRQRYFSEHEIGFESVRWILNGIACAA